MRLLLVEDDARIARFIAKGLREQSYAVDVVASGEEASGANPKYECCKFRGSIVALDAAMMELPMSLRLPRS